MTPPELLIIETLPDGRERFLESRAELGPIVYIQTGQEVQ